MRSALNKIEQSNTGEPLIPPVCETGCWYSMWVLSQRQGNQHTFSIGVNAWVRFLSKILCCLLAGRPQHF